MKTKNVLNKIVKKIKKARTRDIEEAREINYDTLNKMIKSNPMIKLVDVRSVQEFNEGRLNNAINIPLFELNKKAEKILKDKNGPIILYCQAGIRSKKGYEILKQKGYTDLYMLKGGLDNI